MLRRYGHIGTARLRERFGYDEYDDIEGARQPMTEIAEAEAQRIVTLAVPLRVDSDGTWRVAATRVPLDTVVAAFHAGATPEEICQRYSTLDLADVYAVVGYYLRHGDEVKAYLLRRAAEADTLRREHEARHDPRGLRDRLLARRTGTPGATHAPSP